MPILGLVLVLVAGLGFVLVARRRSSRAQASARVDIEAPPDTQPHLRPAVESGYDGQTFEDPLVAALKRSSRGGRPDRPSWKTVDPETAVRDSSDPIWVRRLVTRAGRPSRPDPSDPEHGTDRPA